MRTGGSSHDAFFCLSSFRFEFEIEFEQHLDRAFLFGIFYCKQISTTKINATKKLISISVGIVLISN